MARVTRRTTRSAAKPKSEATTTTTTTTTKITATSPTAVATTTSASSSSTKVQETHFFKDASALEAWLESRHADTPAGIWVKISRKGSGIASVTYDEVIDAGLCYGWIDGQRKSLDERHFLQRFTPRRKGSMWSKRNIGKVDVLTRAGRIRPAGQAEVDAAKADGRWARAYASSSTIEVPQDFAEALAETVAAERFFSTLNKTQRYPFLWRIGTARRPETRQRRIRQFVDLLAEGKTLR